MYTISYEKVIKGTLYAVYICSSKVHKKKFNKINSIVIHVNRIEMKKKDFFSFSLFIIKAYIEVKNFM